MDCAADEQLVRMTLAHDSTAQDVVIDLHAREVAVFHEGDVDTPAQYSRVLA